MEYRHLPRLGCVSIPEERDAGVAAPAVRGLVVDVVEVDAVAGGSEAVVEHQLPRVGRGRSAGEVELDSSVPTMAIRRKLVTSSAFALR